MKLNMAGSVVLVLWLFFPPRHLFQFCDIQGSPRVVRKIVLFWGVTPCLLVICGRQSFGETAPWFSSEVSPPFYCQTVTPCHITADHKMNINFCYNTSLLGMLYQNGYSRPEILELWAGFMWLMIVWYAWFSVNMVMSLWVLCQLGSSFTD